MERALNEIFYDGNVKLKVQRAANSISCKGCFYNTLVRRAHVDCDLDADKKALCKRPRSTCIICKYGLVENRLQWECRRNLMAAGVCQQSFRDDNESVIFVEVCE